MDVGPALVTQREAAKAMEPRQGAFDHPAQDAEAAAVRTPGLRDDGENALSGEARVAGGGPIRAITLDDARLAPRTPTAPGDGRQRGDERFELGDVVDVGGGELCDQRNAAGVRDEVVFRAFLTAIGWVRSSFFPPRSARTEALSITVHA